MASPKLNKLKRVSLQQTSVLFFSGIAAIIFLALITHNPEDCGFFRHDNLCKVTNKAGGVGAYMSDFLYAFFGYLAYLIPVGLIIVGVVMFRFPHWKNPNNPRGGINAWLSVGGMAMALIAGTGLATQLWPDAPLLYKGGGMLGIVVIKIIRSYFGDYGTTLILLSLFFAGITLLADIKWGEVIEYIGDKVLLLFEKLVQTGSPAVEDGVSAASMEESQPGDNNQKRDMALLGTVSAGAAGAWSWLKDKSGKLILPDKRPRRESTDEESDALFKNRPAHHLQAPRYDDYESPGMQPIQENAEKQLELPNFEHPAVASERVMAESAITTSPQSKTTVVKRGKRGAKQAALPALTLLNSPPADQGRYNHQQLEALAENIVEVLGHYGVKDVKVEAWYPGPVITRFELQLDSGTKVNKVTNLSKDLARNLGVHSVRIVEVIPGKTTIGLEVPNHSRDMVTIGSVIGAEKFNASHSPLTLALGSDIQGKPVIADLAKMPHLLVAGTTGAGKSVAVNAMIISMLYKSTAEQVKMIMIDPKMLELSIYDDIPHLLTPVVTDMKDAANALRWSVAEMERRYLLMSKLKVRNIEGFNQKVEAGLASGKPIIDPLYDPTKQLDVTPKALEPLPKIVIIVDEFADMMMVVGKKVEELIARIAQKARAAGIHLILATQRPSVDVITGLIKANIPTRIAFNVSTRVDSRTILDQGGAEQLLGQGDMLYLPPGIAMPKRVHGAFVSDEEVERVVQFVKTQGEPDYIEAVTQESAGDAGVIPGLEPIKRKEAESDPLYDEAVAIITESRRASISYLQRRLKVGYNRAASMIEDMEKSSVVSAVQSNGTREVLAPPPTTD